MSRTTEDGEWDQRRSDVPALTEIRWHGRGGQGAVTAAKMVAEVALGQQKYFQAFPEYGPERSGAPIVAFTRISDAPIQMYSGIEHPQIVAVLDPTLLTIIDVTKGAPDDAVVLINSDLPPARAAREVTAEGPPPLHGGRHQDRGRDHRPLHPQHAHGRRPGAHHRPLPARDVVEFMRAEFGKKFPPKVVEGNIAAIDARYEEVQGE